MSGAPTPSTTPRPSTPVSNSQEEITETKKEQNGQETNENTQGQSSGLGLPACIVSALTCMTTSSRQPLVIVKDFSLVFSKAFLFFPHYFSLAEKNLIPLSPKKIADKKNQLSTHSVTAGCQEGSACESVDSWICGPWVPGFATMQVTDAL